MRVGLLGRKVGMTQIYEADGTAVPVTVLECGPCTVLQVRTEERDGYHAVQLGFADKKRKIGDPGRARPRQEGRRRAQAVRPRDPPGAAATRGRRGADPHGRGLQRDRPGRRHRHEQGARLHGRRQAARLQGPPGHARRQADAPPPGLVRPQCRPGPHPQGDQEAGPARQRPDHRPEPQGRPGRPDQQPASGPGRCPRPQRRLPHGPPDEQGLNHPPGPREGSD